ncbi:MAG: YceI family protein [Rubricoccaceae bacterium]
MVRIKIAALAAAASVLLAAFAMLPAPAAPGAALERLAAGTPVASEGAVTYALDAAHTSVAFRIRHMGVAYVPGRFTDFDGQVTFDPENLAATQVRATVQVASVNTAVAMRDDHLRSADFFEAETYPEMTFTSTGATPTGPNTFRLSGDLTIKGTTRPVTFEATAAGPIADPRAGSRVGFHATTTIDRRDFGITWGQTMPSGVPSVGHQVQIILDVEGVPAR